MREKSEKPGNFRTKIKSFDELLQIVSPHPRTKSVVLCHGSFDIVHPGHLRHLMYAKERGDILVACLVSDEHISKSKLRPSIPEDVRAINLAALEFVDYVVIDKNESPLDVLRKLRPDFFAKGFDYFEGGLPGKAKEEVAIVESYGGEVLFTPGEAESSSIAIPESFSPRLGAAKLVLLMDSEGISFQDLYEAIEKFRDVRVHVIGDTIVDSYSYCRMQGGVSKTPTMSVQFEREINFAGGAAIVSRHMRQAGAQVVFSTVLGDDPLKSFVLKELQESEVVSKAVVDRTRPTIQKSTFIANGYHLLRVGKVDNRIISNKIRDELLEAIRSTPADIVVFSDFRHGIFNRSTIPLFLDAVPKDALKVADSQVASRWGNILEFQGCDLITPNEKEVRFALGDQDSVVRPLARELYTRANCKCLIMTMGDRGILTYRGGEDKREFFIVDSFADHVVDAVGAGDALLSYSSLAFYVTRSEVIASILGSIAAAVACEREGNIPVTPEDVMGKLASIEKMTEVSRTSIDKTVVR
jgi:rfaE bifunctional protein kinase chain/domain/rfaE bifunctional protein nucleotidyltransferase chain/domain